MAWRWVVSGTTREDPLGRQRGTLAMVHEESQNGERTEEVMMFYFFSLLVGLDHACVGSVRNRARMMRRRAHGVWVHEKPGIIHQTLAIRFCLGALLVLHFNEDEFVCIFFWVHNG